MQFDQNRTNVDLVLSLSNAVRHKALTQFDAMRIKELPQLLIPPVYEMKSMSDPNAVSTWNSFYWENNTQEIDYEGILLQGLKSPLVIELTNIQGGQLFAVVDRKSSALVIDLIATNKQSKMMNGFRRILFIKNLEINSNWLALKVSGQSISRFSQDDTRDHPLEFIPQVIIETFVRFMMFVSDEQCGLFLDHAPSENISFSKSLSVSKILASLSDTVLLAREVNEEKEFNDLEQMAEHQFKILNSQLQFFDDQCKSLPLNFYDRYLAAAKASPEWTMAKS